MGEPDSDTIAILGGTGDQGLGLALRFVKAGRPVVVGSRVEERALAAAEQIREAVPGAEVSGFENSVATPRAQIVILSVPFEHMASTVKSIREALSPGQIVVSRRTQEALGPAFQTRFIGQHDLKGISGEDRCFELIGQASGDSPPR